MDPFEVRMQALNLLKRLDAGQESIKKLISFAVRNFAQCGEDIWACIIEECENGSMNARLNILYFLDSLCETCLLVASRASSSSNSQNELANSGGLYVKFLAQDVTRIVKSVVPEGKEGMPNWHSTKQILENWRSKRVIDPQKVDDVLVVLNARRAANLTSASSSNTATAFDHVDADGAPRADDFQPSDPNSSSNAPPAAPIAVPASTSTLTSKPQLNPRQILDRFEQDRERHKRLRERRWVQPRTYNPPSLHLFQLASFLPLTDITSDGTQELPMDIEFDNEWETTSDWNEDDDEAAREETELCFPAEGEGPMDLS